MKWQSIRCGQAWWVLHQSEGRDSHQETDFRLGRAFQTHQSCRMAILYRIKGYLYWSRMFLSMEWRFDVGTKFATTLSLRPSAREASFARLRHIYPHLCEPGLWSWGKRALPCDILWLRTVIPMKSLLVCLFICIGNPIRGTCYSCLRKMFCTVG